MSDNADAIRKMAESILGRDPMADLLKALSPQIVTCKACKAKNRTKPGKANPRCGKCGLPL